MDIVDHEAVDSQEALRERLHQRGIDATQATISRDLKDLGLVKRMSVQASVGARAPSPNSCAARCPA